MDCPKVGESHSMTFNSGSSDMPRIRSSLVAAVLLGTVLFIAGKSLAQPMRPPELPTPDSSQANTEPGYLGMVADDRQESGHGIRVKDVDPESPAAKGGLQADDLITAINGHPAHSMDDMRNMLGSLSAGAQLKFQIERQGAAQTVDVTLGRRPPADQRRFQNFGRIPNQPEGQDAAGQMPNGQYQPDPSAQPGGVGASRMGAGSAGTSGRPLLGVRTLPVTPQDQMRLGLSSTAGAHVVARTLGSPAEKANIPLDSVITAINGAAVDSPNQLSALLARTGAGSEVELTYMYNGRPMSAKIMLASASNTMGGSNSPSALPQPPMPMINSQREYGGSGGAADIARSADMPPRPNGGQPRPFDIPPQSSDAQRIEALERHVQELEQKVQELQQRLQQQENDPPRGT
jgi:membrane-associated protease RseP (regulator of RpoE activity)